MSSEIADIETSLDSLSSQALSNETERKQLLNVLRKHITILESPWEIIWRMIMEPHQSGALRTALEMGLMSAIASSTSPITATQLAESTKADRLLIVRILRPLTCMHLVEEVGPETYSANQTTRVAADPIMTSSFKFMFDEAATSVVHMPAFLKSTNFRNPEGPLGVFQSAFKTDLQLFPWLIEHPEQMGHFNDLMKGQRGSMNDWVDAADLQSILINGFESTQDDGALLVDIGGNHGGDLEVFKKRFPGVKGKLVLQDLPPVIADIKDLDSSITRLPYDFFTAQPIVHSRGYYMRYILHDHPNSVCKEILSNVVAAMKPGYSKLLIYEFILPDVGAPLFPVLLDINMIALLSGMERTVSQWKVLLESCGLEVVRFWNDGVMEGKEGLIEAVRKA